MAREGEVAMAEQVGKVVVRVVKERAAGVA